MASMAELARQLLGMNGNSVGGVSPDRYMEIMDRSPYATGVPLKIGYGEQDQMSPLDAAAMVTGGVPVVGDLTGLAADVDMYMRDPESRNIPNYLLTAAGALPFLPAASQVRQGIKAYHGSPYNFPPVRELEMPDGAVVYQSMDDVVPEGAQVIAEHPLGRFDMSKIGTGEGAQAYGRGLYFAQAEGVGKGYRDQLSEGLGTVDGESIGGWAAEILDNSKGDPSALRARINMAPDDFWVMNFEEGIAAKDNLLGVVDRLESGVSTWRPGGAMYEVNIDVEPDELLDWDKPLSEQSELVRKAVNDMGLSKAPNIKENPNFPDDFGMLPTDDPMGSELLSRSAQKNWAKMDQPGYGEAPFKAAGIKGIRYKDGFSRGSEGGSSNYVIFDDRLITIAKKYGIAIPAAAAYLARMTGEDTSQSYQEAS
jgi:hypothetical protein